MLKETVRRRQEILARIRNQPLSQVSGAGSQSSSRDQTSVPSTHPPELIAYQLAEIEMAKNRLENEERRLRAKFAERERSIDQKERFLRSWEENLRERKGEETGLQTSSADFAAAAGHASAALAAGTGPPLRSEDLFLSSRGPQHPLQPPDRLALSSSLSQSRIEQDKFYERLLRIIDGADL